jgi:NAD+ synthase (glutamine-hydrolysing)
MRNTSDDDLSRTRLALCSRSRAERRGGVGPYALRDFHLYYLSRFGFRPSKVAYIAWNAWRDAPIGSWPETIPTSERIAYDLSAIASWLEVFLVRFFRTSQFKRSEMPNGPKVGSGGSLSPRSDWRAPSDADAQAWIDELRCRLPGAVRY